MAAYILDANALSELIHYPHGPVSDRYRAVLTQEADRVFTSVISACEVRYGALKKNSQALSERVEALLSTLEVASLHADATHQYAALRTDLENRVQLIGPNDMLIAAHALALDAILVTDNVREFKRVKGLRVENWKRD